MDLLTRVVGIVEANYDDRGTINMYKFLVKRFSDQLTI